MNVSSDTYEVTMALGLEAVAGQELRQKLGKGARLARSLEDEDGSGAIQFSYRGHPSHLLQLTTISNAFAVSYHDIPRPRTLCEQGQLTTLARRIKQALRLFPNGSPRNFGISAAGSDSEVMQRLGSLLSQELNLPIADDDIDLLLRIRPSRLQSQGWEVLIRLSPRPLSLRDWRVVDMKGALFAPVASCLVRLTSPKPSDNFLNLACGSGTLLIERLFDRPARRVIGCDVSVEALAHARKNLAAAQVQQFVELHDWDARTLNLPDASIDAICADLPYGIAIGSHQENEALYPALLREAARVAKPRSRCVIITQEVGLMNDVVRHSENWRLAQELKITLRGMHPRIFVLERTIQR